MTRDELQAAVLNGYVDQDKYNAATEFSPQLLSNIEQETVWEHLRFELNNCSSFTFAVAFITTDMLTPLKVVLADLKRHGVYGKILTSNYLYFNQPQVFAELLKLTNVEVKIARQDGFHVKGYLFEHAQQNYQSVIIGSSNLTRAALLHNYEWNMRFTSYAAGAITAQLAAELERAWAQAVPLTKQWLNEYTRDFAKKAPLLGTNEWQLHEKRADYTVQAEAEVVPNKMQRAALQNLQKLRQNGEKNGLVISATGTGKTYLGAFDVKQAKPQRFLFIAHREQILQKARLSFRKVLGGPASDYGILSGQHAEKTAKYLFATIQTLAKQEKLQQFSTTEFDYILIDEAHRAGAASYRRILAYFKPSFFLGMTATPERTDDFNIYQLFGYNIAYEIRLQDALHERMLTPFHYVGLQDYEYQGKLLDDKAPLRHLASEQRVAYVLQQLAYYGYSGSKVHGLIFCSRQKEAYELAELITAKGHPAVALTDESIKVREQTVALLEAGEIEYIVTVNIFNEGIDIPCLNQIVMLRNTQSSIVFIQQLGRGLRKFAHKEYVTIIDFIGNYKNNYLIPLALTGDRSRSKDNARAELSLQPTIGISTINFTEVARQQIYASLQTVKLDSLLEMRQDYNELKYKLGRVPLLKDFEEYGSMDPIVFANNNLLPNYYHFLLKMKEPFKLTSYQDKVLYFMTKELLNGMRSHELLLLQSLLRQQEITGEKFKQLLVANGCYVNTAVLTSIDAILSLTFFHIKAGKEFKSDKYGGQPLVVHVEDKYKLASQLVAALADPEFKKLFNDVLETGLSKTRKFDQKDLFTLYQKYTRKDVCRLLNWKKDVSAPMYGYRVGTDACPIFITYTKDPSGKRKGENYQNEFLNTAVIRWFTRSPRHLYSDEVRKLLQVDNEGKPVVKIHLFVKKSDAEGKDFYYLGECEIIKNSATEKMILGKNGRQKAIVALQLRLKTPVQYRYYTLLTAENKK
ncbi:DUF3427 domain-containing protein [Liquorilactobacillus capillatus]|nr:DEAD/DEAH box helicase [Liquorilactobacillus capillatus]